jgi:hypothetical protein
VWTGRGQFPTEHSPSLVKEVNDCIMTTRRRKAKEWQSYRTRIVHQLSVDIGTCANQHLEHFQMTELYRHSNSRWPTDGTNPHVNIGIGFT